jgi:CheY-like chemotaxis protein
MNILLVDDSMINRALILKLISRTDHSVEVAQNGKEGYDRFISGEFNMVLMDINMPVMDGLTATSEIRKHEKTLGNTNTPIIALTANTDPEEIDMCFESGCDDYIAKSTITDVIYDVLDKYAA